MRNLIYIGYIQVGKLLINRVTAILKLKYFQGHLVKFSVGVNIEYMIQNFLQSDV